MFKYIKLALELSSNFDSERYAKFVGDVNNIHIGEVLSKTHEVKDFFANPAVFFFDPANPYEVERARELVCLFESADFGANVLGYVFDGVKVCGTFSNTPESRGHLIKVD